MNSVALLQQLVRIPGPPGQEDAVRSFLEERVADLGLTSSVDAKGNLLVQLGTSSRVVVTAHMDEIALIVQRVYEDGSLAVLPLGGLYPWKLGEGPVLVLGDEGAIPGVLSFGSIHTEDPSSNRKRAERMPIDWSWTRVLTFEDDLRGVRPGTRVVVHPSRRDLLPVGNLVAGYFLDDRADLVSWLLALEELKDAGVDALFMATVSEEVGGHGALWAFQSLMPEVCIALELGPSVPDAPVALTEHPTVWASDGYASMSAADISLVAVVGDALGLDLQFQVLSRGGSDASASAAEGLCARPITLGLPMENSHGFEIIHPGAMDSLARLTAELVKRV